MNSPLDAQTNNEVVVEVADSQSRSGARDISSTTLPRQSNRLPDETETVRKQSVEDFVVPSLEALCAPEATETAIADSELLKDMLVVDDLPVNRKLIGIQLKKLGCAVDQAENGQSAIEMVQKKDYAIVFMDLDMPLLDGYQAAIAIRQLDLENRQHTPIIGMSSSKKESERQKCVTSGMDDYISKGANSKALEALMLRYPRKKKAIAAVEKEIENKEGVLIDLELLQDAHGPYEAEGLIDIAIGTMKTFMGCLKCAMDDRELSNIEHFVSSLKEPCALLGLNSMSRLSLRIFTDAKNGDWQSAYQGMELLESQYSQILDQLTGLSATHHRVD